MESPDSKDRQILALLFNNSRASLRAIGREVDLSASAVKSRMARLVGGGGITQFVARVNPAVLGFSDLAVFSFREKDIDEETKKAIQTVGKPIERAETMDGRRWLLKALKKEDGRMLNCFRGKHCLTAVFEIPMSRHFALRRLSTTDLLITRCVVSNPRARVDEIAKYASVTAKTAHHRLEALRREGAIRFRINVDASKLRVVEGWILVRLEEGVQMTTFEAIDEALRTGTLFASHLKFDREMVVTHCCAGTVFDVDPLRKRIGSLEGVLDFEAHLCPRLTYLHDWVIEEIDARTAAGRRSAETSPRPVEGLSRQELPVQ